ncbi:hypothetical protein GP486_005677 [Trichoglossum hirsutum]|uniref:Glycosyl transferase family 25 domain-containing protein n=1 Tax=Trichoglossum hirsutum TaxID=265104 RepID=A0A9P8L8V7_9PEZI|nr:hypothetical protein GP486_005677 [Trichoglossum hirsutum]
MPRAIISLPRLAGLVGTIVFLHIVWLYRRHPTADLGDYGPGFRGLIAGGRTKLGGEKNYNVTAEMAAAANETLGFGEIIVISLDYRTDRQDALTLLSSLSTLNLTILHGVTGDETAKSPVIPPDTKLKPAQLGCWRSHVDSWKRIVESGVETALILEDDADWHVNIKEQMSLLSQGFTKWGSPLKVGEGWGMENRTEAVDVEGEKAKEKKGSLTPYGDDWDILWLGQCVQANNPKGKPRPGFSYHDTAAAPDASLQDGNFMEEMELHGINPENDEDKDTRILRGLARRGAQAPLHGRLPRPRRCGRHPDPEHVFAEGVADGVGGAALDEFVEATLGVRQRHGRQERDGEGSEPRKAREGQ